MKGSKVFANIFYYFIRQVRRLISFNLPRTSGSALFPFAPFLLPSPRSPASFDKRLPLVIARMLSRKTALKFSYGGSGICLLLRLFSFALCALHRMFQVSCASSCSAVYLCTFDFTFNLHLICIKYIYIYIFRVLHISEEYF